MEYPRSSSLNWTYFYQGKNMEELKHSLFCTSLELETTRLAAQEELKKREDQILHLKELLNKTIGERDEAEEKCQKHLMDKLILYQQLQGTTTTTPNSGGDSKSSSDCEESIVSSPPGMDIVTEKSLPEKGRLLQAVMKAGPLLQTLLLAGPLPNWRHPPPALESYDIPPVAIPSPSPLSAQSNKKRSLLVYEGSDSSTSSKYQRLLLR